MHQESCRSMVLSAFISPVLSPTVGMPIAASCSGNQYSRESWTSTAHILRVSTRIWLSKNWLHQHMSSHYRRYTKYQCLFRLSALEMFWFPLFLAICIMALFGLLLSGYFADEVCGSTRYTTPVDMPYFPFNLKKSTFIPQACALLFLYFLAS